MRFQSYRGFVQFISPLFPQPLSGFISIIQSNHKPQIIELISTHSFPSGKVSVLLRGDAVLFILIQPKSAC
jgi:hypothetical protein